MATPLTAARPDRTNNMPDRPAHDPRQRLNAHHADELLVTARAFGGHPDATYAHAQRVDRDGIELAIETPRGPATARVAFIEPASDTKPSGVRRAFLRLAREARAHLASQADTPSAP
jgi:hypothetical protein